MASGGYLLDGVASVGGDEWSWFFSTGGIATNYVPRWGMQLSGSYVTATEAQACFRVTRACTVDLLSAFAQTEGTGFVQTFTLRKGTGGGAMGDTALLIAVNDTNLVPSSASGFTMQSSGLSVALAVDDIISLKVVGSGAGSGATNVTLTARVTFL